MLRDGTLTSTTEPPVTNRVTGAVHTLRTLDVLDADGNVLSRTQSDLTGGDSPRSATAEYNAHGQVVKTLDAAGVVTLFAYDGYGNQTTVVTCDSNPAPGAECPSGDLLRSVSETFDAEGRVLTSTVQGPDGSSIQAVSNAYYPDGSLAAETDAMGWTTNYEYWHDGKVKKVSRTDGTETTVLEENTYDPMGNLWSQTTNNGATQTGFQHDFAGRVMYRTEREVMWTDDEETMPEYNRVTNYVYDADDRVITTGRVYKHSDTSSNTSQTVQTTSATYDPMGRLTSETIGNTTGSLPARWYEFTGSCADDQERWANDSSGAGDHLYDGRGNGVFFYDGYGVFSAGRLDTYRPVLDTTQSYSVSAWVFAGSLTDIQTAVGQGGDAHGAFMLEYNGGINQWVFISPSSDSATPSTHYYASSSNALNANQWVHLVGAFDANTKTMSIYVNNVKGTDGTNPTPWASTRGLGIGGCNRGTSGEDQFFGSIDNVQVYQQALSAEDVAALWADGSGRTEHVTASTNQLTTRYTVDDRGLTTAMVDPNGNTTDYDYDEVGQPVATIAPSISAEAHGASAVSVRPTALAGYNAFGEIVEEQDPLGTVTQTKVDALGRPWQTILPPYTPPGGSPIADASVTTVYDKLGQVASTTDPLGKTTTYEYDTLGNRTKVTDPAGKVSTAAYDAVGDLLETVDQTGARSTATYDYLGRMLTSSQVVRQPAEEVNTTTYDYGTGTYSDRPEAGPWLRTVTSPEGVVTSMTYNRFGEQLTVTDGATNTTRTEYDGVGRPVATIRPDAARQTVTYDGADRATQSQELSAAGAALRTQSVGYDDNGNVVASTDGRGTTMTFTHNALGAVTGENQPTTAATSIATSFGYDAAGRQTRFTDGRGNAFWTTYTTWGLPESQIEPATAAYPDLADRSFTTGYDRAGRAEWQTQPGGVRISNQYDDLGRLTEQAGTGAEVDTATRTFGYDAAGRPTTLAVPGNTISVGYDDRGLPLSVSGPNAEATLRYTGDGNLATRIDAAGTTSFGYDTAGRIETVGNATTGINLSVDYNSLSQPSSGGLRRVERAHLHLRSAAPGADRHDHDRQRGVDPGVDRLRLRPQRQRDRQDHHRSGGRLDQQLHLRPGRPADLVDGRFHGHRLRL
ncbi:MAG: hypothetical protein HKP61_17650 [Dactylosporangium sp.]|nr:hypothetical protein [Dactylosporangium sp.]NNJ62723.1 hypothetical protein [Dactylosporangium sp.]